MPEPNEAVQGSQDDANASTPQIPADQPTTEKTSEKAPSTMMDFLDIPAELQERLAPKAVEESKPVEEPEIPVQQPEKDEEPEELEPDEEDADVEAPAAEQPQRVDKRLKRINRLTRQKNDLERQVDHIISVNQRLREELEKGQKQHQTQNQPIGLTGGKLPEIQSELDALDAQMTWCDNNIDGGEIGEGEKAQYLDAATVKAWRRSAEVKRQEKVVEKREEIWNLEQARKVSDSNAYQLWPDMFDKRNPDFQEAVAIIRRYPFLQALPDANLVVGTYLEGLKKLREKANGSKNGQPQKQHRDLDERVFGTPRVPIAPHTSEPPTRESKPSSQKTLNEAMSRLARDTDGSAEAVAAVFAAQDAVRSRPSNRSPVRS